MILCCTSKWRRHRHDCLSAAVVIERADAQCGTVVLLRHGVRVTTNTCLYQYSTSIVFLSLNPAAARTNKGSTQNPVNRGHSALLPGTALLVQGKCAANPSQKAPTVGNARWPRHCCTVIRPHTLRGTPTPDDFGWVSLFYGVQHPDRYTHQPRRPARSVDPEKKEPNKTAAYIPHLQSNNSYSQHT